MQSDNVVILLFFFKMQPPILIEGLRNLTRPEGYVYFLRSNHHIYYHHKNVKKYFQEIKLSAVRTLGLCACLDVTLLALISRT